ncbi:MAG: radical SAM family heme chaperone HemW [Calditrichia bacterium]
MVQIFKNNSIAILDYLSSNPVETPISLYIHIPFCEKKCGYCDFYSITSSELIDSFLLALKYEIQLMGTAFTSLPPVKTIFFGGGTPSILTPAQLEDIFSQFRLFFDVSSAAEISMEVNPGSATVEHVKGYKQLGVNRISVGVQSFHNDELRLLGRIHTAKEAVETIEMIDKVGIEHINLDLMCAFQGQTLSSLKSNLQRASQLPVNHISCYTLILEENTPFHKLAEQGKFSIFNDEEERVYAELVMQELKNLGFIQYEVSNYCRADTGRPCLHNLAYWTGIPYLGFGPSAHSYWRNRRWSNVRHVGKYVDVLDNRKLLPIDYHEVLNPAQQEFEHIFLSLRMNEGLSLSTFRDRFSKDFQRKYAALISDLLNSGFAEIDGDRFKLTREGLLLADEIAARF